MFVVSDTGGAHNDICAELGESRFWAPSDDDITRDRSCLKQSPILYSQADLLDNQWVSFYSDQLHLEIL